MSDVIVRSKHLRAAGFCLIPGVRDWCKQHNVDFRRLMKEGIPASELEATGDLFAKKAVEQAKKDS